MRREAGKFIKRLGAISIAGILGVSVLAGCGAKADTNGGSDSANGVKKVVVGTTGLYMHCSPSLMMTVSWTALRSQSARQSMRSCRSMSLNTARWNSQRSCRP